MTETNPPIPHLDSTDIPAHLRTFVEAAEDLLDRSFSDPQQFAVPPRRLEYSDNTFRAYWEFQNKDDQAGYELFALHLAKQVLTISHEHRHSHATLQRPYVGVRPKTDTDPLRISAVIEQGRATLFKTGATGMGRSEIITPTNGDALKHRIHHALGTIGIS